MAFKSVDPQKPLSKGWHKVRLKIPDNAALRAAFKQLAASNGPWTAAVKLANAVSENVRLAEKSNIIAGRLEPRKGYDAKTNEFWFWMEVLK